MLSERELAAHPCSGLAALEHEDSAEHELAVIGRGLLHGCDELRLSRDDLHARGTGTRAGEADQDHQGCILPASGRLACLLEGDRNGLCQGVRVASVRPFREDIHAKGDVAFLLIQSDRSVPAQRRTDDNPTPLTNRTHNDTCWDHVQARGGVARGAESATQSPDDCGIGAQAEVKRLPLDKNVHMERQLCRERVQVWVVQVPLRRHGMQTISDEE